MIPKPLPFEEAIRYLLEKENLPAEWSAAEWAAVEPDFRNRAFWVSRVENARFLDRAQTLIFDYLAKVVETVVNPDGETKTALSVADRSQFVEKMRDFMIEEGMAKPSEFKDVNQKDVEDIRSLSRLNLIFDTTVRQSYGYGHWRQGMNPAVLRAFPAARLIRDRGVKLPRPRHQRDLGQVRMKTDFPWWAEYHNARSIGGFEVPWGPYGFNSGVTQEDVSRKEAIGLGLPADSVPPVSLPSINEKGKASTRGMDPDLKKKLIDELRGGPKARSPEDAAREAAKEARRAALERGVAKADANGDGARATKLRRHLEEMDQQRLQVRDAGDSIEIS